MQFRTEDVGRSGRETSDKKENLAQITERRMFVRRQKTAEYLNRPSLAMLADIFRSLLEDAVTEVFGVDSN